MAAKKEKNVESKVQVTKLGTAFKLVSAKNGVEYVINSQVNHDSDGRKKLTINKPHNLNFSKGGTNNFHFEYSELEVVEEIAKLLLEAVAVARKA